MSVLLPDFLVQNSAPLVVQLHVLIDVVFFVGEGRVASVAVARAVRLAAAAFFARERRLVFCVLTDHLDELAAAEFEVDVLIVC